MAWRRVILCCNSMSVSMAEVTKVRPTNEEEVYGTTEYQRLVGELMCAMCGTRPDLGFTVSVLSRYSSWPSKPHRGNDEPSPRLYLSSGFRWSERVERLRLALTQ